MKNVIIVFLISAMLIGGWFYYQNKFESDGTKLKTKLESHVTNTEALGSVQPESDSDLPTTDTPIRTQSVVITKSGTVINIPTEWSTESDTFMGGAIEINKLVIFDENDLAVMIINSPIREIGRPEATLHESGTLDAPIGVFNYRAEQYPEFKTGQMMYSWSPEAEGDAWATQSFEIHIPFREGLFARTAEENQSGTGVPVRYTSYQAFVADREVVEDIIRSIQ